MKQFNVPTQYHSPLITAVKNNRQNLDRLKKNFAPTILDFGKIQILLARHFGFCYGVENAIDIAFQTIAAHPNQRIFLLSEMIHNPTVNEDLKQKGILFLQDTDGKQQIDFDTLTANDIVLIPAFGTTLDIEKKLREKKIDIQQYNTTCPFVEKVWNRSEQISKRGYTIIVHGKPNHEETRATFSHASAHTPTVIINDMQECIALATYIAGEGVQDNFYNEFRGRYSTGFNVATDLKRIGVVNQTTQLAKDTRAISDFLKQTMITHFKLTAATVSDHFADTRDTLCYATNDNQRAAEALLEANADIAIVIGGSNSSNTSHLVELCEKKLPTYFIDSVERIQSATCIEHCNWRTKAWHTLTNFLPQKDVLKIAITSGASCPDSLVEAVIYRLANLHPTSKNMEAIISKFSIEIGG